MRARTLFRGLFHRETIIDTKGLVVHRRDGDTVQRSQLWVRRLNIRGASRGFGYRRFSGSPKPTKADSILGSDVVYTPISGVSHGSCCCPRSGISAYRRGIR